MVIRRDGRSVFSQMLDSGFNFFAGPVTFAFGPFVIIHGLLWDAKFKSAAWESLLYTFALVATFIVLVFLNWQFQHIGN